MITIRSAQNLLARINPRARYDIARQTSCTQLFDLTSEKTTADFRVEYATSAGWEKCARVVLLQALGYRSMRTVSGRALKVRMQRAISLLKIERRKAGY